MKFGKRLQSQIDETLPEWRDKYLSYKQLKKRLKSIAAPDCFTDAAFSSPDHDLPPTPPNPASDPQGPAPDRIPPESHGSPAPPPPPPPPPPPEGHNSSVDSPGEGSVLTASKSSSGSVPDDCGSHGFLTAEEADFIHLLNAELEKFNTFFMEKEEEYVIRLQELKERCERMKEKQHSGLSPDSEEMIIIRKEIVNFHGEMVLLENYSSLNYTGLVKILKKHDKRTGALLRMPFIRNVLQQPFFTTELLSKLVRECEMNLQSLFPYPSPSPSASVSSASAVAPRVNHGSEPVQKGSGSCESLHVGNDGNNDGSHGSSSVQEQPRDDAPPPSNPEEIVLPSDPEGGEDVDSIYRSTMAALRTIKELRKGSSTYNVFSLPPFSREDNNEDKDLAPCTTIPICPRD